jgi:hypothetical protein
MALNTDSFTSCCLWADQQHPATNDNLKQLTKQLWVRLTQQFFFSSSDVSATTCFDHFDHHHAA